MSTQEANSPNPLAPVEGNYPGCIAEAALNFGEKEGDVGELTRTLEGVAENCPHNTGEGDLCLLAPVASTLGLAAVESQSDPEQWWLYHDAKIVRYPEEVLGFGVRDSKTGQSLDYKEVGIPVTVGEVTPPIELTDGQMINALLHLQAIGNPALQTAQLVIDMRQEHVRPLQHNAAQALVNLSNVVLASLSKGEVAVEASMSVEGNMVTLADEIDGLIIHGNTRPAGFYQGPDLPQDKIVLPWHRSRSQDIKLSAVQIHAFTNRI